MPRRKIIRTTEEEEEYQRNKRERKSKSQAERRETKRMMSNNKKDSQIVLNTNIICAIPSTSNRLLNLDENRFENCINLDELLSQNIIHDETKSMHSIINKSKQIKWNEKYRILQKGYIDINTSHIIQLENIV